MPYLIKSVFFFLLAFISCGVAAQSGPLELLAAGPLVAPSSASALALVTTASFPGGKKGFAHELSRHLTYPTLAREYAVEGTVIVRLKLDENGAVAEQKIVRSLGFGCDEAAIKALSEMPRWNAARRGNKRVAGVVYVPLRFRLQ